MNKVVLVGRLTREVELRYIAGTGTPVATFTLAVDREFADRDGKRATDFIDIQTWGKQAEVCANYIGKGSLISVSGSIRVESYVGNDGVNRRSFRINADRVQFLDSRRTSNQPMNTNTQQAPTFEPNFGSDFEFSAIDDQDLPF